MQVHITQSLRAASMLNASTRWTEAVIRKGPLVVPCLPYVSVLCYRAPCFDCLWGIMRWLDSEAGLGLWGLCQKRHIFVPLGRCDWEQTDPCSIVFPDLSWALMSGYRIFSGCHKSPSISGWHKFLCSQLNGLQSSFKSQICVYFSWSWSPCNQGGIDLKV